MLTNKFYFYSSRHVFALILFTFLGSTISVQAQKKVLDHPDFDIWNTIKSRAISNTGDHVLYTLEKGEKDNFLKVKTQKGDLVFSYDRAENATFSDDSKSIFFKITAWKDSITELKRRKVKNDKLPKDTLAIYDLQKNNLMKIANVQSYKLPEKWSGYVAYMLEDIANPVKKEAKATTDKTKKKKEKKVSKTNGYHLVLMQTENQKQDTLKFVTSYAFAKEGKRLLYTTTGDDANEQAGVYLLNLENNSKTQVFTAHAKAKYNQLSISETGKNIGFVVDVDTTKVLVRPTSLYLWKEGMNVAEKIVDPMTAPKDYRVSPDGRISFSKDETKMYFGFAKPPIVQDTTLLAEEIVNVEVWTYDEPRLYTVQELQVNADKRKSYEAVVHLDKNNKLVPLASTAYPDIQTAYKGNANIALLSNDDPYMLESQWTGERAADYALINTQTGAINPVFKKLTGRLQFSPKASFLYGYNAIDSSWFSYDITAKKQVNLTKGRVFYNELHDSPSIPGPYGIAGWTTNDEYILIYDRYDIWKFNPKTGANERLTKGRENNTVYRYIRLDNEETNIDLKDTWLLSAFNDVNKHSGYVSLNPRNKRLNSLLMGPYSYSRPVQAQKGKAIIYTRESFEEFPNIHVSDISFKKDLVLSDANPQQKDYNWGTVELVYWTSLEGKALTGMLIKPENFDPNKKYPMLVNFYERSSDGLYSHKAPSPGRSSINYSFYTSRGYVIFNPDIVYRDGYPGESAYNAVIPGITSLIDKGFINKDKIGAQGHSWGGYQVAHLATKTDIFAAIESGAPVVNMISAYGGIRWDSGLSRQFQYEHTQSRIGGTPWEYPMRYIENSPIYNMDKVNTPILIMHNDKDGHVPWYQGIEYFTALRRLGKPTWLLNYNGARHWPLKMENRKDFNIRMAQFFDYYLKDAPKPVWMERGVPALEKGINQGYELIKN